VSVQLITGSRGVHISSSDAGYTMFRGSVKGTGYSFHSQVSPLLPLLCAITFQLDSIFKNLVLYHLWLCSIILNPTVHFFMQSDHLNWYMQHHITAEGEKLSVGKSKYPTIKRNSSFNTSQGASEVRYSCYNMELILQKSPFFSS